MGTQTETDERTWPPPPTVAPTLFAYDAFLAAQVRDAAPRPPITRSRLVRGLRRQAGLDARQSRAAVNDFCERHGLFPEPQGVWERVSAVSWGAVAVAVLLPPSLAVTLFAHHLRTEAHPDWPLCYLLATWVILPLVCLLILALAGVTVEVVRAARREHRDAEEARKRLSLEAGGP